MQKIIDIHSHMFNLKYLPVAGILLRYSNNKIPVAIARGIEWLLLKGIDESYEAKKNALIKTHNLLELNIPGDAILKAKKSNDYEIGDVIKFDPDDMIEALYNMADERTDIFSDELLAAIDEFEKMNPDGVAEESIFQKANVLEMKAVEKVDFIRFRFRIFRRMLRWVVKTFKTITNHIKWFLFMRNSEEEIYQYIKTEDGVGVEKYLHLMMDVDHFFNEEGTLKFRSHFDFEYEQIPKMQELNLRHEDLIGFVAFNPARGNALEIVKDAIIN